MKTSEVLNYVSTRETRVLPDQTQALPELNMEISYSTDQYGVIHQVPLTKTVNDSKARGEYVQYYNRLGVKSMGIACLRLGYILGVIDRDRVHSFLDVGYGNGDFLRQCAKAGYRAYGIDISGEPVDQPGVRIVSELDLFEHYSIVTFFDALEHFEDMSFLEKLDCRYLVISVPWCHWEMDAPEFMEWKHRKPGEHLHHFSATSLGCFLSSHGFDLLHYSDVEDAIRQSASTKKNILTAIFRKRGPAGVAPASGGRRHLTRQ